MVRALIYDRTSVRDDSSQEEHLRRCRAFCAARDWEVVLETTHSASGFRRDVVRPHWEEVRAAVDRRDVEAVVVFAVSRAGRNVVQLFQFVELCEARGVTFASATEPIDTGGEYGRIFLALLAALAEMESKMKRDRALVGRANAARHGTWIGGWRPYGWKPVGNVLEVDPEEAEHVRAAADLLLNGASLNAAAAALNARGSRPSPGGEWTAVGIAELLTRDSNAPKILTLRTLTRVKRAVAARARGPRRPRYLLTGLAECGVCGARVKGKPTNGIPRYVCSSDGHLHLAAKARAVDEAVTALCADLVIAEPEVASDPSAVPEKLAAKLAEVEARLEELGAEVEDGALSEAAFRGRERRLRARADDLEQQIAEATERRSTRRWLRERIARGMPEPSDEAFYTFPETRAWLETLVERVVILPPGRPGPFVRSRVVVHERPGVTSAA